MGNSPKKIVSDALSAAKNANNRANPQILASQKIPFEPEIMIESDEYQQTLKKRDVSNKDEELIKNLSAIPPLEIVSAHVNQDTEIHHNQSLQTSSRDLDQIPGLLNKRQFHMLFDLRRENPKEWTPSKLAQELQVKEEQVKALLYYYTIPMVVNSNGENFGCWTLPVQKGHTTSEEFI